MTHPAVPDAPEDPFGSLPDALRRFVLSRVGRRDDVDDIVQEAITRTLAARDRVSDEAVESYAITTARNLIASSWRADDLFRRHQPRLAEREPVPDAGATILDASDRDAMARALRALPEDDRELLVAHEVERMELAPLARRAHTTPAALGARLHRIRARLRVEYLIEDDGGDPPTARCRTVLVALSVRDQRRQQEARAEQHVAACSFCARIADGLGASSGTTSVVVRIAAAPDIVTARQKAREVALAAGLAAADLTMVATAVSEAARNVLQFAGSGEIVVAPVERDGARGVRIIARDRGPGIADVAAAMRDGFSTSRSLGLGLPGIRRLMDDFELTSEPGVGTTLTFTKWRPGG